MSADIAQHEPTSVQSGNTIEWDKSLSDFPAGDGWALTYAIRSTAPTASLIDITATADGDDFSVSVPASTTANWQPGTYWMVGYVTLAPDRYEVYRGALEITPNIAALGTGEGFDGRTIAQRLLAKAESELEDAIRSVEEYGYNGVNTKLQLDKLKKVRDELKAEVANEQTPTGHNRKILTRFTAP